VVRITCTSARKARMEAPFRKTPSCVLEESGGTWLARANRQAMTVRIDVAEKPNRTAICAGGVQNTVHGLITMTIGGRVVFQMSWAVIRPAWIRRWPRGRTATMRGPGAGRWRACRR
jgi:hypothetical protein